jgi:membrane protease YdiL (CAAX protease family)
VGTAPLPEPGPSSNSNVSEHPPWWDVFVLVVLTVLSVVIVVVGMLAAVLIARKWIYPYLAPTQIAHMPLVAISAQAAVYVLILGCMYLLVTRVQRRQSFLAGIDWNWPASPGWYLLTGFVLSIALQALAHFLPIPKDLPMDEFFRTPAEAWSLGILSITLAPLMEELFFRGFLYPVLARRLGLAFAVFLTALAFAALHGAQLMFSWGPVLVIFLVGLVLTIVRAKTNSVAAGVLIHMAYNGTITVAMFAATDGFRHLEKLNQ